MKPILVTYDLIVLHQRAEQCITSHCLHPNVHFLTTKAKCGWVCNKYPIYKWIEF